jgi:hypothetical protein
MTLADLVPSAARVNPAGLPVLGRTASLASPNRANPIALD